MQACETAPEAAAGSPWVSMMTSAGRDSSIVTPVSIACLGISPAACLRRRATVGSLGLKVMGNCLYPSGVLHAGGDNSYSAAR